MQGEIRFREVLRPPLWLLAFIYFLLLSMVIAIWAAFDNRASLIAFIFATGAMPWIYRALRSEITIDGNELRIDRAHISLHYLENAIAIDTKEVRFLRTQGADPAAYLAIRFWLSSGVKVDLNDSRDPTPYWLITTRKATQLVQALKG
jgi:hypothetical protein